MIFQHEIHGGVKGPPARFQIVVVAEPFKDHRRFLPRVGHALDGSVFFLAQGQIAYHAGEGGAEGAGERSSAAAAGNGRFGSQLIEEL